METVSRRAYFGGFILGISIAVAGYHAIPALGLDGAIAAFAELATVALAMGAAFALWRASARAGGELDTSTGAEQRKEGDEANRNDPRGV